MPELSTRASFCCTKKIEKNAYIYSESCIYLQTLKTTVIYSSNLFTYNAKYLPTFLGGEMTIFCQQFAKHAKTSLHSARSCKPTLAS